MKRENIITSVLAIVVGLYLGTMFLKLTETKKVDDPVADPVIMDTSEEVTIYQIGVYTEISTILEIQNLLNEFSIPNVVTSDDEYTYIYSGVCINLNSCEIVKEKLDEHKITYYEKGVMIDNDVYLDMIKAYESSYHTQPVENIYDIQVLLLQKLREVLIGEY